MISSKCVSLKACKGEVHNMLSLMRRKRIGSSKARFHSEIPLTEESDIYRQFKIVQETLQRANDLKNIDTLVYLRPFLFGIRDGYVVFFYSFYFLFLVYESTRCK